MAPFKFAKAILSDEPIDIYNYGHMERDFTYVDDIVEGIVRIARQGCSGYRLLNIGSSAPVPLLRFVSELELALGKRARKRFLPMQAGDVVVTYADVDDLAKLTGYRPLTPLREGVKQFAEWFLEYSGHTARELVSVA